MSEELKHELAKTQAELTITENLHQPEWLGHLAPQAKIHIIWASIFHSLKGPQGSSLGDCVKMATGEISTQEGSDIALWCQSLIDCVQASASSSAQHLAYANS